MLMEFDALDCEADQEEDQSDERQQSGYFQEMGCWCDPSSRK